MTPPADGQSQQQLLLNSIDSRLSNLDNKVDQIHIALVGSLDGKVKGLHARVEQLESWLKWLAGLATAAITTAIGAILKGWHH